MDEKNMARIVTHMRSKENSLACRSKKWPMAGFGDENENGDSMVLRRR